MSKVFRDSESLGEKGWKEMVSELNILLGSGLKSPRKKKFFFADFHSTCSQNWVHQQNNICVGAPHFDPWCTLNLISSHDRFPGLSLVTAPGVKIGCINTTFLVLEHYILTLGALLTYYLANTSHTITSQASRRIGATIRIGQEIQCLPYAGFFMTTCSIT
jgi:hypothetical protein